MHFEYETQGCINANIIPVLMLCAFGAPSAFLIWQGTQVDFAISYHVPLLLQNSWISILTVIAMWLINYDLKINAKFLWWMRDVKVEKNWNVTLVTATVCHGKEFNLHHLHFIPLNSIPSTSYITICKALHFIVITPLYNGNFCVSFFFLLESQDSRSFWKVTLKIYWKRILNSKCFETNTSNLEENTFEIVFLPRFSIFFI